MLIATSALSRLPAVNCVYRARRGECIRPATQRSIRHEWLHVTLIKGDRGTWKMFSTAFPVTHSTRSNQSEKETQKCSSDVKPGSASTRQHPNFYAEFPIYHNIMNCNPVSWYRPPEYLLPMLPITLCYSLFSLGCLHSEVGCH